MKTKLNYDYLKNTALWQDWASASKDSKDIGMLDKLIGRFYYVNWQISGKGLPHYAVLGAYSYPVLIDKGSTEKQKEKATLDGFENAWKAYKKELRKLKLVSIAPVIEIPKAYQGMMTFYE